MKVSEWGAKAKDHSAAKSAWGWGWDLFCLLPAQQAPVQLLVGPVTWPRRLQGAGLCCAAVSGCSGFPLRVFRQRCSLMMPWSMESS